MKKKIRHKYVLDFYSYFWHSCYSKMFGYLIKHGKKLKVFNFMTSLRHKIKKEGFLDLFYTFLISFMKIVPKVNFKKKRKGRIWYDVPMSIKENKRFVFVNKLIFGLLKKKKSIVNVENASSLIISALFNEGESYRTKVKMHSLAIKNRYLLRYLK